MQRFTLWLIVASVTFVIGVIGAMFWMLYRQPEIVRLEEPTSTPYCFPGLAKKIEILHPEQGGYFPEGAFSNGQEDEHDIARRYSKRLAAMNEVSYIAANDVEGSCFRFLWLRSFHAPIAISLCKSGEKYTLTVKQLINRDGGGGPVIIKTRNLTKDEWTIFSQLVETTCFWQTPTTNNEPLGTDGAWWVLEAIREGRYHVVHRQSPRNGKFRELCLYLLKLSNLELDAKEIY